MINEYSQPLQVLFTLPEDPYNYEDYDFLAIGITPEHIPELTKLILDEKYYLEDPEDEEWLYPHLFAYRALAQLKTEEAIDAMLQGAVRWGDSDWFEWFTEIMPKLFAEIGAMAIPALTKLLQSTTVDEEVLLMSIDYLRDIGRKDQDCRDSCVTVLIEQLRQYRGNPPTLNGFLVSALTDFKALEALGLIEEAYEADRIDEKVMGNWDDIQVYFGLKDIKELPVRRRRLMEMLPQFQKKGFDPNYKDNIERLLGLSDVTESDDSKGFDSQKAKTKRKQQKQARRKNRGRK